MSFGLIVLVVAALIVSAAINAIVLHPFKAFTINCACIVTVWLMLSAFSALVLTHPLVALGGSDVLVYLALAFGISACAVLIARMLRRRSRLRD